MQSAWPEQGQTVVVQFGPTDISFTRCEATKVDAPGIELRPVDPLSGTGHRGESARLIFTGRGRPNFVNAYCTEDATESRMVVVPDRRLAARHAVDLAVEITVEHSPQIDARLIDLSVGGLRAKTSDDVPVGIMVSVRITDDRGVSTRVDGEVVDSRDGDVRLRFLEVSDFTAARLERMLSGDDAEPVAV